MAAILQTRPVMNKACQDPGNLVSWQAV